MLCKTELFGDRRERILTVAKFTKLRRIKQNRAWGLLLSEVFPSVLFSQAEVFFSSELFFPLLSAALTIFSKLDNDES